jgi:uncharacterized protein (UPF0332 family)
MPFDWNDFLNLADELATRFDVASKRTAISRAYYSVFNPASARAESKVGPRPKGVSSHQWGWDQYIRTPDLSCQRLGNTGDRMKRMRHKADYGAADIFRLDDVVQRVLQEAHELLAGLTDLDPKYPQPRL